MSRTYDRLSIEEFGEHLLDTDDLDPIYVALHRCLKEYGWEPDFVHRWLVAYWCFYHAGVACWMATFEAADFWRWMDFAAVNDRRAPAPVVDPRQTYLKNGGWPRGHERRHFRGAAAVRAVRLLSEQYERPERMVELLIDPPPGDVGTVMSRATNHYLFGPWIGFKVADMIDRVLEVPVDFDRGHVFMFKDPVAAALMLWRQKTGQPDGARPRDLERVLREVTGYLETHFLGRTAPPLHDRKVGLPEIETILCKWKSHMNGHYPLWNDIDDIRSGLEPWMDTVEVAAAFSVAMPGRRT